MVYHNKDTTERAKREEAIPESLLREGDE